MSVRVCLPIQAYKNYGRAINLKSKNKYKTFRRVSHSNREVSECKKHFARREIVPFILVNNQSIQLLCKLAFQHQASTISRLEQVL